MWKAITNIFKDNKGYKNEFTERMKSLSDEVLEDIGKYYFDDKLEFSGYFEDYYDKKDKSSGDARINSQPWITLWVDEDPSGRKYSLRIDWSNQSNKHNDPDIQLKEIEYRERTYFVYILILKEGEFINTDFNKFNKIMDFIKSDEKDFKGKNTKTKQNQKNNKLSEEFTPLKINKKILSHHLRVGFLNEVNFQDSFVSDIKKVLCELRLNEKSGNIKNIFEGYELTTKKDIQEKYIDDSYTNYIFISNDYSYEENIGFEIYVNASYISIFPCNGSYKYYLISASKHEEENLKIYNENLSKKKLFYDNRITNRDYDFLTKFNICLNEYFKLLEIKNKETIKTRNALLSKFDSDNNGIVDITEYDNEISKVLKKNQTLILEKEKELNAKYIQSFIKVDNYIKLKRQNIQLVFDTIKGVEKEFELKELTIILEEVIHSHNLLLINSFHLINSLLTNDQITFFEIYERFDKLNIFNSNYENEMLDKLNNIDKNLTELNNNIMQLMNDIQYMSNKIIKSINELSFITAESTKSLNNRLIEVKSSMDTNNLLTLINTYQNYKTNKNTKSLN
jgi:hypothetical protein